MGETEEVRQKVSHFKHKVVKIPCPHCDFHIKIKYFYRYKTKIIQNIELIMINNPKAYLDQSFNQLSNYL